MSYFCKILYMSRFCTYSNSYFCYSCTILHDIVYYYFLVVIAIVATMSCIFFSRL